MWWSAYGGARAIADDLGVSSPALVEQFLAASWASFWTVFVTSPLDVLKTRTQLSPGSHAPALTSMARSLIAEEGLQGLYRGFLPRWGQASIFTGSVISLYEHLKVICRKSTTS